MAFLSLKKQHRGKDDSNIKPDLAYTIGKLLYYTPLEYDIVDRLLL